MSTAAVRFDVLQVGRPQSAGVPLLAVLAAVLVTVLARLGPGTPAAAAVGGPLDPASAMHVELRAGASSATWRWPLAGPHTVSRPFSPGPTPYAPGHRGADLPADPGAAVLAAGTGRVAYAGTLAGRGVVVVVHGTLRTTYEPVTAVVRPGQPVTAGQQLGTLEPGHDGCSQVACLHWGLRRGQEYLDPVRLLRGGPVRLLPRTGPVAGAGPPPAPVPPPPRSADRGPPGAGVAARRAPPGGVGTTEGVPGLPGRGTAVAVTGGAVMVLGAGALRRRRRVSSVAAARSAGR